MLRAGHPATSRPPAVTNFGVYTEEWTLGTEAGPEGPGLAGTGMPGLPGSRIVGVPDGKAPRRAEAPTPRAGQAKVNPLAKMLRAALCSALAVWPQAVHRNRACVLGFALSTCWHTAQVGDVSAGSTCTGPPRLVGQLAFQETPVGLQDPAVEAGLLPDVPVRRLHRALGTPGHGLDVQILQHHGVGRVRHSAAVLMGSAAHLCFCLQRNLDSCKFTSFFRNPE